MDSKEKIASQMLEDLFTRPLLLSFLKEKFNIKLPKNAQFHDIVKLIVEENLEQDFCQAIFKEWELDVKVANFEEAYDFYRVGLCLSFFNVEQLNQMAEDLSRKRTKWAYKRNRGSLCQSIMNNVSIREIEEYIQRQIREKQIPPIQQSKFGWILGPSGLIKSTVARKPTRSKGMVKFLLHHVAYPSPYNELKNCLKNELGEFTFDKRDPLLREKFCQSLLAKLSDEKICALFNKLIDKESLKIASVEKYWSFTATPHGIFEPPYFGDENLAYWILRIFPKEDLLADFPEGKIDNIEQLVREKCITETPDKILDRFFGSGPWLRKLAKKIDLVRLHRIENEKVLRQAILLKLGFSVPPELEGIVNFASKLKKHCKDVESGLTLSVDKWNDIYSFLERILEDLALFYSSVLQRQKLMNIEEEKRETEIKGWIRKTFKLEKPFDSLTLGDLCALLRDMNRFLKDHKNVGKRFNRLYGRTYFLKDRHLDVLDFVKGCRTELTKIHLTRTRKQCDQIEVLRRLVALFDDWNSETGRLRTYPYLIRLKQEVTNEFGVRYYTVVDEENRIWHLKTREWIEPEDVYFMTSDSMLFAINPILLKKFW